MGEGIWPRDVDKFFMHEGVELLTVHFKDLQVKVNHYMFCFYTRSSTPDQTSWPSVTSGVGTPLCAPTVCSCFEEHIQNGMPHRFGK